ncbi:uncharacterized protein LOC133126646 [Conger conger]|uniref:uncharacterized protein LOC133126646 n=1 Tax=Conger conger TaxID=82655 RepID=UPI002A5A111B|nr:uncharacterized protein LOC133126646 [Conger conger]
MRIVTMGDHNPARVVLLVLSLMVYIIVLAFNAMAGPGIGPFIQTTKNVSDLYDTEITPSGWTFSIWGIIYAFLTAMLIYIFTALCRRNAYGWMYCSPAVLPYGFFVSWIVNMSLNIIWLILWDRELMIPGLIVLALVAFTNYLMVFFSCHGLHAYGAWLNKYHRADLWCLRVLVQNGICVYTTWTTIATLINFNIVLTYEAGVSKSDGGTVCLAILLTEVITWFVLENFVLEKHVRYILTIYPVVIMALAGNMTKNFDSAAPSRNGILIALLLAVACTLFLVRVALVTWRHVKQPLYQGKDWKEEMSPMEIAEKQKKIFLPRSKTSVSASQALGEVQFHQHDPGLKHLEPGCDPPGLSSGVPTPRYALTYF